MKTLRAAITIVHTPDSGANLQSLLDSIQEVRDEVRDLTPPDATNILAAATQSVPGNVLPLWEIDADLQGAEESSIDSLTVEETAVAMPSVEDLPPPLHEWLFAPDIPPGSGPDDSLFFATDGSVDETNGKGGYSSVTPHPLHGWTRDISGTFSSREQGVTCYGAEKVAVDTCELMAVVDVLENAPQENLTLLVDASYIMFGFNAHSSGLRRQIRSTNRALWYRAREALSLRRKNGFFVRFRKCSSHNKDPNQHPLISLWNDRADKKAKAGCNNKDNCLHEWTPDGDFSFQILHRGKTVRGDPRKHIGASIKQIHFDYAESLKDGGVLPSLVREKPCKISIGTLRRSRSPVHLARAGLLELHGFAYSLQNLCLPTPSRFYQSKEPDLTALTAHLPRVNGKCICPLCGDSRPDTWHYATPQCTFTEHLRQSTQLATGNVLAGICSLGLYDPELPNVLMEWLKFHFSASIGSDRVSVQSALGGLKGHLPSWDGSAEWPLLLCSTTTLLSLLRQPDRPEASVLLSIPAGRFPVGVAARLKTDKPSDPLRTIFEPTEVCWVLLRNTRDLPLPSEQALLELTAVISRFILLGPTELSLHWGGSTFPLDDLETEDGLKLLKETGLLQTGPRIPPRSWHQSHSWLGILPTVLRGSTGKSLALLTSSARQQVKDTLARTILAGQHHTWVTTQSMITRYLKRQKLILKAALLQKPAPIFRRLYSSLGPTQATFPPSVDVNNKATKYLRAGGPIDREGFRTYAATLGLGSKLLPAIWLAVLMQGVNRGKEELAALRGVSEEKGGLELCTPRAYSMPYISPENRGKLLQAEAAARSEIIATLGLPETRVDTRTPLERCRDNMRKRLRSQRLTPTAPLCLADAVDSPTPSVVVVPSASPPAGNVLIQATLGLPEARADTRTPLERCRDSMRKRLQEQSLPAAAPSGLADAVDSPTPSAVVISIPLPAGNALNIRASGPSDAIRNTLSQTSLESPLDISDIPDTTISDITEFLPAPHGSPIGHLLRPLSPSERAAAAAIAGKPQDYGLESLSGHLFGRSWYNTAVISNIVDKLTAWARDITNSDRWVFLPPDIINGLASGRLHSWARRTLLASISDDTQHICFICNTGTHWYLIVADCGSSTMNIFNSYGTSGNILATNKLLPFLLYMGSFGSPQFRREWNIVLQDTVQQSNGWDCGPHTVANCLSLVYAWDRIQHFPHPSMTDFRLRVAVLTASQVTDGYWQGRC